MLLGVALAGGLELDFEAADHDPDVAIRRSIQRVASRVHHLIRADLGLALPAEQRVAIRTVADRGRYEAEARALGLTRPTLGFFSTAIGKGVVWRDPNEAGFRGTLVHELTHYLLASAGAVRVPPWLQEGMAEVMESAVLDGNAVWLRPDPRRVRWLQDHVDALPPVGVLLGEPRAWERLPRSPSGAPYDVGWSLCAFLLSSPEGKATLSEILVQTAGGDPARAAAAAAGYPRGLEGLDAGYRAWLTSGPRATQLPVPLEGGVAPGWKACLDGSQVRLGTEQRCGRWVTGEDGWLRYEEDP